MKSKILSTHGSKKQSSLLELGFTLHESVLAAGGALLSAWVHPGTGSLLNTEVTCAFKRYWANKSPCSPAPAKEATKVWADKDRPVKSQWEGGNRRPGSKTLMNKKATRLFKRKTTWQNRDGRERILQISTWAAVCFVYSQLAICTNSYNVDVVEGQKSN